MMTGLWNLESMTVVGVNRIPKLLIHIKRLKYRNQESRNGRLRVRRKVLLGN